MVEVNEDLALSHLGYVVHSFAGIVPNPGVLVCKAGENGWNNNLEVFRELLLTESVTSPPIQPGRV